MKLSVNDTLWKILLPLAFLVAVLAVMAQANPAYHLPGRDSGFFMYAADLALKGKQLYVDVWDSKGPFIFFINMLGLMLGRGSPWGVWLLEALMLGASVTLLYRVTKQAAGPVAALLGGVAGLWLLNSTFSGGNLTEEYSLFFSMLALAAYMLPAEHARGIFGKGALLGACTAVILLIRPNNLGMLASIAVAAIVLALINTPGHRRGFLPLVLGGLAGLAVVLAAVALYFAVRGTLSSMVEAAFLYNFFYAQKRIEANPLGMLGLLMPVQAPVLYLLPVLYLSLAWRWWHNRQQPLLLVALVNLPLELAAGTMLGRGYIHYLTNTVAATWLVFALGLWPLGLAVKKWPQQIAQRLAMFAWVLPALVLVGVLLAKPGLPNGYLRPIGKLLQGEAAIKMHPYAQHVLQHTSLTDTVMVWPTDPALNVQTGRAEPIAVVFYPILVNSPISTRLEGDTYRQMKANPPKYIYETKAERVDSFDLDLNTNKANAARLPYIPNNFDELVKWINKHYIAEYEDKEVVIWRYTP